MECNLVQFTQVLMNYVVRCFGISIFCYFILPIHYVSLRTLDTCYLADWCNHLDSTLVCKEK